LFRVEITASSSEFNSQGKLDHLRSVDLAGNFSEIRISDVRIDSSKPDMIENVEGIILESLSEGSHGSGSRAAPTRVLVDHPRLAKTESTSRRRVSESKRRRRGEGGSVNIGKSRRRVSDVPITLVAVDTHVPREGRIVIGEAVTHQGRVARSGDGSERNVRLEASDA
jgi:hypothetical protein